MDDEYLDYWDFDEDPMDDDIQVSIYTLLPAAAVFVSILLVFAVVITVNNHQGEINHDVTSDAVSGPPEAVGGNPAAVSLSSNNNRQIAVFFTPSVQFWEANIIAWAAEWQIDPNLVATVMQIESCGHPDVVSSAGAMGLFQVMPFHFEAGEAAFDPRTNASRGLDYLSRSLTAHDANVYYALAGYNAGITGSQRLESAWPAETKRYTYWGSGIFTDASENKTSSARLDEWLAKGGSSLCARASAHLGLTP